MRNERQNRGIPYSKLCGVPFGGDYNPEQWPEDVWDEDMRIFEKAGINTVTLNVFSWAALQPSEDIYDFSKLDAIVKKVTEHHMNIIMATSTAAHPAWMARRHQDVLRVESNGIRRKFGGRHNSCPNSPSYRGYSALLAKKLAERYAFNKNVIAWHISNEYGGECYCENCERAFRIWLQKKYCSLESLNRAWNTAFWGHTFYDFDEIVLPGLQSENFLDGDRERTMYQGIALDYRRFMSDSLLECMILERDAIREVDPDAFVTTNLMGFYKNLDYFRWGKEMDFASWDNYPSNDTTYSEIAMSHDLMRGCGGNHPFFLMEQTPSVTNWLSYNSLKRPGVMRLWSYQAMAHGSDSVLFFQLRRSIGGCEKYHGAVIDHVGNENTRVFREVLALGAELKALKDRTSGGMIKSEIAMIFDWDIWWSTDYSAGPSSDLDYKKEFMRIYEPLRKLNYSVDIISEADLLDPDFLTDNKYKVLIAPLFYMVKGSADESIRNFVKKGGTFVTGFFSGYVQENDLVTEGGYPGKLRDVLGIWVEEEDALPPDKSNSFIYGGEEYPAFLLCDLLHTEGAKELGGYEQDFYAGMPVITENNFGKGTAYYIGCASSEGFYRHFFEKLLSSNKITPVLRLPEGVEATVRTKDEGAIYYVLNHTDYKQKIDIPFDAKELISQKTLKKGEVKILDSKDVMLLFVQFPVFGG